MSEARIPTSSRDDASEIFSNMLGGGRYNYLLRANGWTQEEINAEGERIMREEFDDLNAYCGGALTEVHESWITNITYLSALRLLIDREGISVAPVERFPVEEPEDYEFDDLGIEEEF